MNQKNIVNIVRIVSLVLSVAGMVGSAWAGSKENKIVLAELVDKHFENQ